MSRSFCRLWDPPALLLGASARSRIERGRGAIGGRGLATAAMVQGAISTALLALFAPLTPAGVARALCG